MALDLDGEVIAEKVVLIYNEWALAAVMGRIVTKICSSDVLFTGHRMEGREANLVTWTPTNVRVG